MKRCFQAEAVYTVVVLRVSPYKLVLGVLQLCLARACEKVSSDLGLGGGFHWAMRFAPPPTCG